MRVLCLECGSMVCPVVEGGILYYSAHYRPGGVDCRGFCSNTGKIPKQLLDYAMEEGRRGDESKTRRTTREDEEG